MDKDYYSDNASNPQHPNATASFQARVAEFVKSKVINPKSLPSFLLNKVEQSLNAVNAVNSILPSDTAAENVPYRFDKDKFITEALDYNIKVIASIDDSSVSSFEGSVLVIDAIGKNARVNIANGRLFVLGNIDYGAMIDVRDRTLSRNAVPGYVASSGITVIGHVGDHVRLNSTSNILIQDAGNFVQLRALTTIKAGNIGYGANLMARDQIESGVIGDDLRSTHYVLKFSAKEVGKRAIIKAGSIYIEIVNSSSDLVASYGVESNYVDNGTTITARNISIGGSGSDCQFYASLNFFEGEKEKNILNNA